MSSTPEPLSPGKKYAQKMLDLIEKDPQIAALQPKEEIGQAIIEATSLQQAIDIALTGYSDRPAVGERSYDIAPDPETGKLTRQYLPSFTTITYAELRANIIALANAWCHHPEQGVAPGEMVCIMGFTSRDFAVIDIACVYAQAVTVPLQSATSGADLSEIFANVAPVTLATTISDLEVCTRHAIENGRMRSLVVFDYDARDEQERERFEAARGLLAKSGVATQLTTLDALIDYGSRFDWTPLPAHPQGLQRMAAILHSSGSTGKPKGAMMPEDALKQNWEIRPRQLPMLGVCIAPLNHLLGRSSLTSYLRVGGTAYFTLKPDMSTLFEDIRIVRPTYVTFFPRIFEMIYQHYQNEVARKVRAGEGSEEAVSAQVAAEMGKHFLGDRLHAAMIGGAPTSKAIKDFMCATFDFKLNEGYGNTESGGGGLVFDGVIQRPPVIAYRLRDVPELGYYTTDKPYPRGEFCFKARGQISGYYKAPEVTAELYDEDGYSLTGDIVEERGPDRIVVIDRRKDVLKLSQGEYVAVGTLGTVFEAGSPVIKQIYIYGNSHRAYLLAAVVPDLEVAKAALGEGFAESELKQFIRDEMQRVAREQQLKSFEVPRDFILDEEAFSQENGLLSSVRKRLRPALKRKYGERLEALYTAHEKDQDDALLALKDPESLLTVAEKLKRLLEIQLKVEHIDTTKPRTFAELGGDSLGAVLFSMAIEDVFGVTVPADTILSPTANAQKWANTIEQALSGDSDRPTFSSIHGRGAHKIFAKDLALERFIGADAMRSAVTATPPVAEAKTVLLTGGNGFLGRLVCLNWMEKLAPRGGKVIALVRAADDAAARARLDQAFKGVDADFEARYQALAKNHLEVLAGDAGAYQLGLPESVYARLTEEVDRISHVAALVNHRFSYPNLFGPNVVGTAEIVRLALAVRLKPVDFVSSEAVFPLLDISERADEDAPLQTAIELMDNYAAGYGASKWAGEHLLQQAHRQFGLPVNTFRGDMMLPHRQFKGVLNREDMFTRLLFSIIKTGLAPLSFYRLMPNGSLALSHYDGTPVDVVAAAVTGADDLAEKGQAEYRNYNIQNFHHDDGCSLDAFVDWIRSAGYPVTRITDHKDWFTRFKDKLNGLPEAERQQSALEILKAFQNPLSYRAKPVACERFRALVPKLAGGPELPHLDEAYLHKCLNDMRLLGLIGPADVNEAQKVQAEKAVEGKPVAAYAALSAISPVAPFTIKRRLPAEDDVAIDILYCGVCHSDLHYVKNEWGVSMYPLVPGHEMIGRVAAVGKGVSRYREGDLVAVGCMVDSCRHCASCDDGLEQYCEKGVVMTYSSIDYRHNRVATLGGYSKHIVVNERFVLRVPENLDPAGAAPLLCAGITTYSPLRQWGVGPGTKVGVIGLGGLGHMGIKLAHAMGAEVVMITTSPEKGADARRLGASDVLISKDREAMRAHRQSFDFLLDTVPVAHALNPYLNLLRRDGTLAMVGALEPMEGIHGALVSARRLRVVGSMIGGIPETQEMLDFCGEHNITADVEVINMQAINEAYQRMLRNEVKYRFVIDMATLEG